jgi:hypothetical protein
MSSISEFTKLVTESVPSTRSKLISEFGTNFGPTLPRITTESITINMGINNNITQELSFKRPLNGVISVETPATIMIAKKSGEITFQSNKFILQQLSMPKQERFQIIETFGSPHVFFYGERSKVYTMQGVLLDAFYQSQEPTDSTLPYKHMWARGFQYFYDNYLRGSRLIATGSKAILHTNGWLIYGYPVQLVLNKESMQMPDVVSFAMTWVVEKEIVINSDKAFKTFNGVQFNPDLITKMNKYQESLAAYREALIQYNQTSANTRPDLKSKMKSDIDDLEINVTVAETELKAEMSKLKGNHSIQELRYD